MDLETRIPDKLDKYFFLKINLFREFNTIQTITFCDFYT